MQAEKISSSKTGGFTFDCENPKYTENFEMAATSSRSHVISSDFKYRCLGFKPNFLGNEIAHHIDA
jgi:hypothetical protein